MRGYVIVAVALALSACASTRAVDSNPAPRRSRQPVPVSQAVNSELERRIAGLEVRLLEKEAQVEELQARLADTRQEVVRAMAKLQTLATRAEAASGMAEAEVALKPLNTGPGQPSAPEAIQASMLLNESSTEFDKGNFDGALYLANQAKALAASGRGRLLVGQRSALRAGETPFALPLRLKAVGRGNVREGPNISSRIGFTVEAGAALTGYSHANEWIRISDADGRSGWIVRSLIARP